MEVQVIKATSTLQDRAKKGGKGKLRVAAYARVSTGSEEQLMSYTNQVKYYKELIASKPDWVLVDVYADEAITGTKTDKRIDFMRMIDDCMMGNIDMVITKSISRFARNTVDTLGYVRKLKDKNIAVMFEEENINTLTMDGELLLTILSSVAQQEVQNISEHVKLGLKMRMKDGQLIGFNRCLGYDYHPEDKSITINEEEAEIVRYIYRRYIEGAGSTVISKELQQLGYHPPKIKENSRLDRWHSSTINKILRNEKYCGDIINGKTFTLDPISKKRIKNRGEVDQFYSKNHHEAIIPRETWEHVQELIVLRSRTKKNGNQYTGEWTPRQYALSLMCKCGYCGGSLTRRTKGDTAKSYKVIWQCVTATKEGKPKCPNSLAIDEACIQKAFVDSINEIIKPTQKPLLGAFIRLVEDTLLADSPSKKIKKIESEIEDLEKKKENVIDLMASGVVSKDECEKKYKIFTEEIALKNEELTNLKNENTSASKVRERVRMFREALDNQEPMKEFDRETFDMLVNRVEIGGKDSDGNVDPHLINFILKFGALENPRTIPFGETKEAVVTLMDLKVPYRHFFFIPNADGGKSKKLIQDVNVKVSVSINSNVNYTKMEG